MVAQAKDAPVARLEYREPVVVENFEFSIAFT